MALHRRSAPRKAPAPSWGGAPEAPYGCRNPIYRPIFFAAGACRSAGYRRIGRTTTGDYMTSQNVFEEIDRKMKEILARGPAADLEKNLRALLASAFGRLDLVTREEFDVQREVLARTRARLQELEAKLAELEKPGDRQIGKS